MWEGLGGDNVVGGRTGMHGSEAYFTDALL